MARRRKDTRLAPLRFTPYRWVSFKVGRKPRGRRLEEHERDAALKLSSENTRAKLDLAFRMASLYDAEVGDLCHFLEEITYPFPTRTERRRRDGEFQNQLMEAESVKRVPPNGGIPEEELEPSGSQSFGVPNCSPSPGGRSSPPRSSALVVSSGASRDAVLEQRKRNPPSSSQEIVTAKRVRKVRSALRSPAGSYKSRGSGSPETSRTAIHSQVQGALPSGKSRSSDHGQSENGDRNGASRGLLVPGLYPHGQGGEEAIEVQRAPCVGIPPEDLCLKSHTSSASSEKSGFTSPGSPPSPTQSFMRRRVSGSATPCSPRNLSGSAGSPAPGEHQPIADDCSHPESVELGSTTPGPGRRVRRVSESESSDSSPNTPRDTAAVDDVCSSVERPPHASLEVVVERQESDSPQRFSERRPSTPVSNSTGFTKASELEPPDPRTFATRLPKVQSLERHSNSSFDSAEVDDSAPSISGSLEEPQRDVVIDQPKRNFLPDSPEPLRSTLTSDSDLFSETLEPASPEPRVPSPEFPGVESSELSLKSSRKLSHPSPSTDANPDAICRNTLEQPEQGSSRQSSEIITAMQVAHKQMSCALDDGESHSGAIARLPKFESPEKDPSSGTCREATPEQPEQSHSRQSSEIITAMQVALKGGSRALDDEESHSEAIARPPKFESPEKDPFSGECRNTTPEQPEQSSSRQSSEIITAMQVSHERRSVALGDGESHSEAIARLPEFESPEKDFFHDIVFDQPQQDHTCSSPEIVSAMQVVRDQRSYARGDDESSLEACSEPRESELPVQDGSTVEGSPSSDGEVLCGESPPSGIGRCPHLENDSPRSQIDNDDIEHRGGTIESPEGSVSETMPQEVSETLSDDDTELLPETPARSPSNCAESTESTRGEHSPEAAASLLDIALDWRDEETTSPTELDRDILESSCSSPGSTPEESPLEALVSDAKNSSSEELSSFWLESARREAMDSEAPDES